MGIQLAQALGGEILSADSRQIYRYMDIGTAKPTPKERAAIPHHLIDILEPEQPYSAGKFVADADRVITRLVRNQTPCIILGGTSLYIRALMRGIVSVPTTPPDLKKEIFDMVAQQGLSACFDKLKRLDPKSAKILHPNDISRICRALEVVLHTGRSIRDFQGEHRFQTERYKGYYLGIWWERDVLYDRINRRVNMMVQDGLIDEVAALIGKGYHKFLPAMRSIGYKQAVQYLAGSMTKEEMLRDIQQKTRRYAKKQITWCRRNKDINWLHQNKVTDPAKGEIFAFLESG